jgi:iron(III) transport system substrate-binding protein
VGALVAALLLVAGCGSSGSSKASSSDAAGGSSPTSTASPEWQKVLDAANKEGSVVWYYVVPPPTATHVIDAFEKAYPDIKVQGVRVLSEVKSKLDAERTTGSKGADVVSHSEQDLVPELRPAGQLVDIKGPAFADWASSKAELGPDAVVSSYTVLGIAWNTDAVSTPLKGYEDLLKPEFKGGKIGIVKPSTGGTADYYSFLEKHLGDDFLTKLAAQKPRVYETLVPMQQALEAGEIDVASYATPSILADKDKGAPVEYLQVNPAWGAPIDSFIVKWNTHPNAAQVFMNFMLSKAGQRAFGQDQAPGLDGVKGILMANEVDPVTTSIDEQNALISEWNKTFGR